MKSVFASPLAILSGLLLAGAQVAHADQKPGYSQAGISYFNQRLDDARCRQDGLVLDGSLDLNGEFFAVASFADATGNRGCGSTGISAGGGYRMAFNPTFDMYGTLSFETISPDVGSTDSGLILAGGMRGFLAQEIEAKIELAHHTVFNGSTTITGGGAYWFNRQFAATTDLTLSSNGTTFAIGARMNF